MLEPEIAAFIDRASKLYPSHRAALTPREQRSLYDRYAALLTPPLLTLADVHAFRDTYWGENEQNDPNGAAPTHGPAWTIPLAASRFDGLPPTLAIGAEHDPLRDDARVFVERIRAAGGDAQLMIGTGLVHGCWRALDTSPGVQAMHRAVCDFLRNRATESA